MQEIRAAAAAHLADFLEILVRMQLMDDRSAEFIGNMILHKEGDAVFDETGEDMAEAGGLSIMREAVLDIHRDIIGIAAFNGSTEDIGAIAIRVELDLVSDVLEASHIPE